MPLICRPKVFLVLLSESLAGFFPGVLPTFYPKKLSWDLYRFFFRNIYQVTFDLGFLLKLLQRFVFFFSGVFTNFLWEFLYSVSLDIFLQFLPVLFLAFPQEFFPKILRELFLRFVLQFSERFLYEFCAIFFFCKSFSRDFFQSSPIISSRNFRELSSTVAPTISTGAIDPDMVLAEFLLNLHLEIFLGVSPGTSHRRSVPVLLLLGISLRVFQDLFWSFSRGFSRSFGISVGCIADIFHGVLPAISFRGFSS